MKKSILVVLMLVMIATPCIAEVEPDGIFSIEGTLWRYNLNGVHLTPYPPYIEAFGIAALLGFSDGKMFGCVIPEEGDTCTPDFEDTNSYYVDCPVLSLAYIGGCDTIESGKVTCVVYVFLMQPIVGVGYATARGRNSPPGSNNIGMASGFMVKESDDFLP